MRSGSINIGNGHSGYVGVGGNYWPSTAASKRSDNSSVFSAYILGFAASGSYPSNGPDYRWFGFPLRCLARGGGSYSSGTPVHLTG